MTYSVASLRLEAFLNKVKQAQGDYWMAKRKDDSEIYRIGPIKNTMVAGIPVTPCDANYQPIEGAVLMAPDQIYQLMVEVPSPSQLLKYMRASRKLMSGHLSELRKMKGLAPTMERHSNMICPGGFSPAERDLAEPVYEYFVPKAISEIGMLTVEVGNSIRTHRLQFDFDPEGSPTQYERIGAELCIVLQELSNVRYGVTQDPVNPTHLTFHLIDEIRPYVKPRIKISLTGMEHNNE